MCLVWRNANDVMERLTESITVGVIGKQEIPLMIPPVRHRLENVGVTYGINVCRCPKIPRCNDVIKNVLIDVRLGPGLFRLCHPQRNQ